MSNKIKEETSINGAQLDALKRFFTDLEGNAVQSKLKTDNKLNQNKQYDNRLVQTQKKLFDKRKSNDIFNATQNSNKKDRENLWRKSVYIDAGIEGNHGYPSIEVPSAEKQLQEKLEK